MSKFTDRGFEIVSNTAKNIGKEYFSNITGFINDAKELKSNVIKTGNSSIDTFQRIKKTSITKRISDWFYNQEMESEMSFDSSEEFDPGFKIDSNQDVKDGDEKPRELNADTMTDINNKQTNAMYKIGRKQTEQSVINAAEIITAINDRSSEILASVNNINKTLLGINENLIKLTTTFVASVNGKDEGDNRNEIDGYSLFGSDGRMSLSSLFNASRNAIKNNEYLSWLETGLTTVKEQGPEGILSLILGYPLEKQLNSLGGRSVAEIAKGFNDIIDSAMQTAIGALIESGPFKTIFGDSLNKRDQDTDYSRMKPNHYTTDKAIFDGMTRMSIIKVIPEMLAKINTSLSGKTFNIDSTGNWVEGPIKETFSEVTRNAFSSSGLSTEGFKRVTAVAESSMGKSIPQDDLDMAAKLLTGTVVMYIHNHTSKRIITIHDIKDYNEFVNTTVETIMQLNPHNKKGRTYWTQVCTVVMAQINANAIDGMNFIKNVNTSLDNMMKQAKDMAESDTVFANQTSQITQEMYVSQVRNSYNQKPETTNSSSTDNNSNRVSRDNNNKDYDKWTTHDYTRGIYEILNRGINVKLTNKIANGIIKQGHYSRHKLEHKNNQLTDNTDSETGEAIANALNDSRNDKDFIDKLLQNTMSVSQQIQKFGENRGGLLGKLGNLGSGMMGLNALTNMVRNAPENISKIKDNVVSGFNRFKESASSNNPEGGNPFSNIMAGISNYMPDFVVKGAKKAGAAVKKKGNQIYDTIQGEVIGYDENGNAIRGEGLIDRTKTAGRYTAYKFGEFKDKANDRIIEARDNADKKFNEYKQHRQRQDIIANISENTPDYVYMQEAMKSAKHMNAFRYGDGHTSHITYMNELVSGIQNPTVRNAVQGEVDYIVDKNKTKGGIGIKNTIKESTFGEKMTNIVKTGFDKTTKILGAIAKSVAKLTKSGLTDIRYGIETMLSGAFGLAKIPFQTIGLGIKGAKKGVQWIGSEIETQRYLNENEGNKGLGKLQQRRLERAQKKAQKKQERLYEQLTDIDGVTHVNGQQSRDGDKNKSDSAIMNGLSNIMEKFKNSLVGQVGQGLFGYKNAQGQHQMGALEGILKSTSFGKGLFSGLDKMREKRAALSEKEKEKVNPAYRYVKDINSYVKHIADILKGKAVDFEDPVEKQKREEAEKAEKEKKKGRFGSFMDDIRNTFKIGEDHNNEEEQATINPENNESENVDNQQIVSPAQRIVNLLTGEDNAMFGRLETIFHTGEEPDEQSSEQNTDSSKPQMDGITAPNSNGLQPLGTNTGQSLMADIQVARGASMPQSQSSTPHMQGSYMPGIEAPQVQQTQQSLSTQSGGIREKIANVGTKAMELGDKAREKVFSMKGIGSIAKIASGGFESLGKIAGGQLQALLGIGKLALAAVTSLASFKAIQTTLDSIFKIGVKPLNSAFTKFNRMIKPVARTLTTTVSIISKAVSGSIKSILESIGPMLKIIKEMISYINKVVLEPFFKIFESTVNLCFMPLTAIAKGISWVLNKVFGVVQLGTGGILFGFGKLETWFSNIVTGIGNIAGILSSKIQDSIEKLAEKQNELGSMLLSTGNQMIQEGLSRIKGEQSFESSASSVGEVKSSIDKSVNLGGPGENYGSGDVYNYYINNTYGAGDNSSHVYNQTSYGNYMNMNQRGCGPVALAEAYARRTGGSISPIDIARASSGSGDYYEPNKGMSVDSYMLLSNRLGMNTALGGVTARSLKRATPNNPITLLGSGSDFGTRKGNDHYVNVIGTDSTGMAYVSNPLTGRISKRSATSLALNSKLGIYGSGDVDYGSMFSTSLTGSSSFSNLNNMFSNVLSMFGISTMESQLAEQEAADKLNELKSQIKGAKNYDSSIRSYDEYLKMAKEAYMLDNPQRSTESDKSYKSRIERGWNKSSNIYKYLNKVAGSAVNNAYNLLSDKMNDYAELSSELNEISKSVMQESTDYAKIAAENRANYENAVASNLSALVSNAIANASGSTSTSSSTTSSTNNGTVSGTEGSFSAANGAVLAEFSPVSHTKTNITSSTSGEAPLYDFFSATGSAEKSKVFSSNGNWYQYRSNPNSEGVGTSGDSHSGVDFLWEDRSYGKELHATTGGTATAVQRGGFHGEASNGGAGNNVKWRDSGGMYHWYMHMSSIDDAIQPNANIEPGQLIGYVGDTGSTYGSIDNGAHLHYTITKNQNGSSGDVGHVNPLTYFSIYTPATTTRATLTGEKIKTSDMLSANSVWSNYSDGNMRSGVFAFINKAKQAGLTAGQIATLMSTGIWEDSGRKIFDEKFLEDITYDVNGQAAKGIMNWMDTDIDYGSTVLDQLKYIKNTYFDKNTTDWRAKVRHTEFDDQDLSAYKTATGRSGFKLNYGDLFGPYMDTDLIEGSEHFFRGALVPDKIHTAKGVAENIGTAVDAYNWMIDQGYVASGVSGTAVYGPVNSKIDSSSSDTVYGPQQLDTTSTINKSTRFVYSKNTSSSIATTINELYKKVQSLTSSLSMYSQKQNNIGDYAASQLNDKSVSIYTLTKQLSTASGTIASDDASKVSSILEELYRCQKYAENLNVKTTNAKKYINKLKENVARSISCMNMVLKKIPVAVGGMGADATSARDFYMTAAWGGDASTEQAIFNRLYGMGMTKEGAAGMMGNLRAESNLISTNLQDSFEGTYNDESYTAAVDNGSYGNFSNDSYGYGLAQWTSNNRKAGLYKKAKEQGVSIGDLAMQLSFLYDELTNSYSTVWNTLKSTSSVNDAASTVLTSFESPADQSSYVHQTRQSYAQDFYNQYAASAVPDASASLGSIQSSLSVSTPDVAPVESVNAGFTNSGLAKYIRDFTGKYNRPRTSKIKKLTWHHMAGKNEDFNTFYNTLYSRDGSVNYAILNDGSIGRFQDEGDRAWTSSDYENDNQAVTFEISNNVNSEPWTISDEAMKSAIALSVDVCKRNGIDSLTYTGDKNGTFTHHRFFADTSCPGPYIVGRSNEIVKAINEGIKSGTATINGTSSSSSSSSSNKTNAPLLPAATYQRKELTSELTETNKAMLSDFGEKLKAFKDYYGSGDTDSVIESLLYNDNSDIEIPPLDESKFKPSSTNNNFQYYRRQNNVVARDSSKQQTILEKLEQMTFNVRAKNVENLLEKILNKMDSINMNNVVINPQNKKTNAQEKLFTNDIPSEVSRLAKG